MEERFRKKLALWKRQYISKGGRLTLIKSTLSNLLIYTMLLYRMPTGVKLRLEKIQRDFLWGGGNLDRKIHLVNWGTVCKSKESGGLGVRRLEYIYIYIYIYLMSKCNLLKTKEDLRETHK